MRAGGTAVVLYNDIKEDAPWDVQDVGAQADWLSDILGGFGFRTVKLPFSLESKAIEELIRFKESGPTFALNLVDTAPGEWDLPFLALSILKALEIPYSGCNAEAMLLTTNKVFTKELLKSYGLPTPEWVTKGNGRLFIPGERYIIKPVCEDASIGLDRGSVVSARSLDELSLSIARREEKEGMAFFAERYIDGREFNACIYGTRQNPVVLPPYEWLFPGFEEMSIERFINYDAKWTEHTFEYDHLTAVYHLPEEDRGLIESLTKLSTACWEKFGLDGYARIDFRIDGKGAPWVLDINTNPSFYGFYNVAKAYGLDFNEIVRTIVEAGWEKGTQA